MRRDPAPAEKPERDTESVATHASLFTRKLIMQAYHHEGNLIYLRSGAHKVGPFAYVLNF
jgi:hypothetical protein